MDHDADKLKPPHYKTLSVTMMLDDLGRLDDMVQRLKAKGFTKANRSAIIRFALDQIDISKIPKGL